MNYPDAAGGSSAPADNRPYTDKTPGPTRAERNPIKAIRRHCLRCMGGSAVAVAECVSVECALWPFRTGKNPYRTHPSGEPTSAILERGRCLAGTSEHDPEADDGGDA